MLRCESMTFQRFDETEVINKNCLWHLVYLKEETTETVKSSSLSSSSIDEPSPTKIPCKTPEWITVTKTIIITIRPNEKQDSFSNLLFESL
ncbi:hypothetical protein T07_6894 [Trichinella nelsoni]|uniref:Uncharacterized protein n=1 Tax=Trichinella nelsoni TaxID=6336 RepID=A0A0V0RRA7_9BILA|nr:hypothetical protein T07_6894 [Trichinella nelsoni]